MAPYVDFQLLPQLLVGRKQPSASTIAKNLALNCAIGALGGFLFEGLGAMFDAMEGLGPAAEMTEGEVTVVGRYPAYTDLAQDINANYLNVPTEQWNAMSSAEQWATNQQFLDDAIARGDSFRLASQVEAAEPGTFFQKELDYLYSQGYTLSTDGGTLLPPRWK